MAKKKFTPTEQMNVRILTKVLKDARQYAKKSKLRLGQVVNAALEQYVKANIS